MWGRKLGEGRGLVNDQPGRRMTLMKLAPLPASPARNESQSLSSPLSAPLGAQVTEITFCSNCKALIKERGIGALVARLFRLFAGEAPPRPGPQTPERHKWRVSPPASEVLVKVSLAHSLIDVCVLLLQDLLQSCSRGGGREWRTCATRVDEPRPVWTSLPITH